MKRVLISGILLLLSIMFFSIQYVEAAILNNNSKILIAYFSRAGEQYAVGEITKGNTAKLAELISKYSGGDLYEIKPAKSYPTTYLELEKTAKSEKEKNIRPALIGKVPEFNKYDVVFVGFPIWHGDMPMPVYTFLESNDFSDKTIIPFCTHEGSGIAGISPWIRAATHAKYVHRGFAMHGYIAQYSPEEAREDVQKWIKKLKE